MSIAFDNPEELSDSEIIQMVSGFVQSNSSTNSFDNPPKISVNHDFLLELPQDNASTRSNINDEKSDFV